MATLPEKGATDALFIMDLSGFVFRAYHALPPLSNKKGEATHAVHGVVSMLERLLTQQAPSHFAIALDVRGGSFRKDLYPEYKANRKTTPPDLLTQAERVRQVAIAKGIPCLSAPKLEADDIIATLTAKARAQGLRVVIASADKDLLQLVGDGVVMYDSMKEVVYGVEETRTKMGVPPHQIRDYLALVGDTSDNVPGVPSVGPKTAIALLEKFSTIEELYRRIDEVEKRGLRERLVAHKEEALLSQTLVTLKYDAAIELDQKALKVGGEDVGELAYLFEELELNRALSELERRVGKDRMLEGKLARMRREPSTADAAEDVESVSAPTASTQMGTAPVPVRGLTLLPVNSECIVDAARLQAFLVDVKELALMTCAFSGRLLDAPLLGVALASARNGRIDVAYVPLGHSYLGRPSLLSESVVAREMSLYLGRGGHVVAHDLKRELLLWSRFGLDASKVPTGNFADIMLAQYLLDAEEHNASLEQLSESSFSMPLSVLDVDKSTALDIDETRLWIAPRVAMISQAKAPLMTALETSGLFPLYQDMEMPLMRELVRMEEIGVAIDSAMLDAGSRAAEIRIADLERRCHEAAGHAFNVNSPRVLETVLFDELKLPVVKRTKTARSTDHDVLEELSESHSLPRIVLELRMLQKLKNTYLDALPKEVRAKSGRVHTRFNQAVAATGRLSSSEPNLQNIPIRSEEGRAIRNAFVGANGWKILSVDYSQIELRVLAHVSGDPELVSAFQGNKDVHVRTASALFGVAEEDVDKDMRARAKTVNFAVIYGQTEFALARNLDISRGEAKRYIDAFFKKYAGAARYLDSLAQEARENGGVRTLFGRYRRVPNISSTSRGVRLAAERVAKNTPIQGTAADIMKKAMVDVARAIANADMKSRLILTVHDELLFEVTPGEEATLQTLVGETMSAAMVMSVPLAVGTGIGNSWGTAHG